MSNVIAGICLYGSSAVGTGFLVQIPKDIAEKNAVETVIGDGGIHLNKDQSFTEAVWKALNVASKYVGNKGNVRVFAPGGLMYAEIAITERKWFGDLKWVRC
jgi:hypothetical protein